MPDTKRLNRTDDEVVTADRMPDGTDTPDNPDNWQWETVQEESATRVIFDTIGDEFIGQYKGSEHITPANAGQLDADGETIEEFDLFRYIGRNNEPYAINASYSLVTAMEKVKVDEWVRITYTKDLPTKRGLNPMKDFRVDVRRK